MPEAVKSLKKYFDTTPPNKDDKLFNLSPDSLNDHLRKMTKAAGIRPTGQIKWNLLRKFLFSGLLKAMDLLSAKLIMGKRISSDLLTYFITEEETLKKRYMKSYPFIRLAKNGDRISDAEKELELLRRTLRRIIDPTGDYGIHVPDDEVIRLFLKKTSK